MTTLRRFARKAPLTVCAPVLALPAAISLVQPTMAQTQQPSAIDNTTNLLSSTAIGIALPGNGALINSAIIDAPGYAVQGNGAGVSVINSGAIGGGIDGVSLTQGGSVANSGSIFGGHIGVYTGGAAGSVSNSGQISAGTGDAVSLFAGGTLTNQASGRILGASAGVYANGSGSSINNAGLITGPAFGVYLMGDSAVTNSGSLAGGTVGLIDIGHGGEITNTGLIHGGQTGVQLTNGASLDNAGNINGGVVGVKLGAAGSLTNAAAGQITGGVVGVSATAGSVINNQGSITGGIGILVGGAVTIDETGMVTGTGGSAIALHNGASSLTLGTGAQINGAIDGTGTASAITLAGHGDLSSPIVNFGAGSLTVAPNAAWTVTGNWAVGQVTNNGTLTAGLVGTPLTIQGNFTQGATGTLRVVVTPTGMNQLIVTGHAQLGGTLAYVLSPGTYAPGTYAFLNAAGGVSGDFTSIVSTDSAQHARTLTSSPAASPLLVSTAQSLAPSALASAATVTTTSTTTQTVPLLSLAQSVVVAPQDASLFANAAQDEALSGDALTQTLLAPPASGTGQFCSIQVPQAAGEAGNLATALAAGMCRLGGWVQASATDLSTSAYSAQGGGVLAGLDRKLANGRIGFAVGYDQQDLLDKQSGKASMQAVRLGLYGGFSLGRVEINGALSGGLLTDRTTRPTGAGYAIGKGTGGLISGGLQAALPIELNGLVLRPAIGLRITHISLGALSETAATQGFAVQTKSASGTYVAPYLRMSVAKRFLTASGVEIVPRALLGVTVNATNPGASTSLVAADGSLTSTGATHLSPVSAQLGAGLTIGRGAWRLSLRYEAALAASDHTQSVQAELALRF